MQELIAKSSDGGGLSPVSVWEGGRVGTSVVGSGRGGGVVADASAQHESAQMPGFSDVRLADAARGEIYACFEGPLGAHLKPEVKERIW